jgi:hypothetical protein
MGQLTTVTGMSRLVVGSVVIPFLFVIAMSRVEYLAKPRLLWDLMTDVGWDMCILGIGVTGGIFSAPEMEKGWGPEGSLLAAVIVIAVNLVAGIGIQILKRDLGTRRVVGTLGIVLGIFAVALPSALSFWR